MCLPNFLVFNILPLMVDVMVSVPVLTKIQQVHKIKYRNLKV